jgi:hypothetical protein
VNEYIFVHDLDQGPHPEFSGPEGMAWAVVLPESQTEAQKANLDAWLIFTPQAHPAWQYHLLTLIHLREIPGAPPAELLKPGATHQITLLSIDPDFNYQLNPQDFNTLRHLLSPADYEKQVILPDDKQAREVVSTAVEKCVNGELIPDPDGRPQWEEFLHKEETERAVNKSTPGTG